MSQIKFGQRMIGDLAVHLPLLILLAIGADACKHKAASSSDPMDAVGEEASSVTVKPQDDASRTATNIFQLTESFNGDTLSLPDLIRLANAQKRTDLIETYLNEFQKMTGIKVEIPDLSSRLSDPDKFTDLLQMDFATLDKIRKLVVAGLAKIESPITHTYLLPNNFEWSAISGVQTPAASAFKELGSNGVILRGYPDNPALTAEAKRQNSVLGEVIERLATNEGLADADKFHFIYQGQTFTDLPTLLNQLTAKGYAISAEIDHYVANFMGLWAKKPDGTILPVAAPMFVRTSIHDSNGIEAVLPALHSEIMFQITPPAADANALRGTFSYYQGTGKTGFYCKGCSKNERWVGGHTSYRFSPSEAQHALILAGRLVSVIRAVAVQNHLAIDGYGATGVCNDSVAVVQKAVTGQANSYQLLINVDLLLPEIQTRLQAASGRPDGAADAADYTSLTTAVSAIASDVTLPPDAKQRAMLSLPWAGGDIPFVSSIGAQAILSGLKQ